MSRDDTWHNRLLEESPELLRDLLMDHSLSNEIRVGAATALACSSATTQYKTDVLLLALQDPEEEIRVVVIFSLGMVKHPVVIQELRRLVQFESGNIRLTAIRSLAHLADPEIFSSCAELISHGTLDEKIAAIGALTSLRDDKTRNLLEFLWHATNVPPELRYALACGLAKLGSKISCNYLQRELSQHQTLHLDTLVALSALGDQTALQQLRSILQLWDEFACRWLKILLLEYLSVEWIPDIDPWRIRALDQIDKMLNPSMPI